MNLSSLYQVAILLTFLTTGFLAAFVLARGIRRPIARLFGIYTLAICAWSFCWFKMIAAGTYGQALFWACFLHYPASFIPATYLHFVQHLLGIHKNRAQIVLRRIFYGLGVLFLSVSFAPGFNKTVVPKMGFVFFLEPGPWYVMFLLFFMASVLIIQTILFLALRRSHGFKKTQIAYVFFAYALAYTGGTAVFLPVYNMPLPWFSLYLIPVSHMIVSYAILKHKLMDISIVIRKTLLYSIVSAILVSIYAATITLLAQVLGRQHGSASVTTSALAAIFITLLFNPLRIRTQGWIDRQFPRERLDPGLLQEAAGGFAHEMKRPLSKISLPAELALMDLARLRTGELPLDEGLNKMEERLKFIMHQSVDAGYMIEAIRELSASSAAALVPVDVGHVLDNALKAEKELLDKYGIAPRLGLPSEPLIVPGRARQLEIVLINLIKNAAEAMSDMPVGKERELTIKVAAGNGDVVLTVSDNGPGIKPEELGKVFQPQYTTKGAYGTGMGLYLSHQIAQSHGGTLTVESEEGRGAIFTLKLPD